MNPSQINGCSSFLQLDLKKRIDWKKNYIMQVQVFLGDDIFFCYRLERLGMTMMLKHFLFFFLITWSNENFEKGIIC